MLARFQLLQILLEALRFVGSIRRKRKDVKRQSHVLLSPEVPEGNLLPILIFQGKIGRHLSDFDGRLRQRGLSSLLRLRQANQGDESYNRDTDSQDSHEYTSHGRILRMLTNCHLQHSRNAQRGDDPLPWDKYLPGRAAKFQQLSSHDSGVAVGYGGDVRTQPMPTAFSTPATLADIFFTIVDRNDARAMLYEQRGTWVPISSRELYRRVAAVAAWLRARGVVSGDRVAILAENRPEWAIADFAALMTGAVVVPIYATQTAEQCAHILRDSETRVLFVSSEEQLNKVLPLLPETRVEHLILMDEPGGVLPAEAGQMQAIMKQGPEQRDPEFDQAARQIDSRSIGYSYLHFGDHGHAEGRHALASQPGVKYCRFSRALRDEQWGYGAFLPAAVAYHRPPLRHRYDVSRREYRILFPL